MIKYLSIIILIIIIIYLLINEKEGYDGRISNILYIEDCADIASSIYGISSFNYNPAEKKCYVSRKPQIKPPLLSAYSHEYNSNNLMCNKEVFMRSLSDISNSSLIANRLYTCYTKNNYDSLVYFQKNKILKPIDKTDINKLGNTVHNFNEVELPTSQNEIKDLVVTTDKHYNLYIK